ncbi:hypothetical protein PO909_023845 [Leuciscus waleckii]
MASVRALLLALLSVHALDIAIADKKFGFIFQRHRPRARASLRWEGPNLSCKQIRLYTLHEPVHSYMDGEGALIFEDMNDCKL